MKIAHYDMLIYFTKRKTLTVGVLIITEQLFIVC